MTTTSRLLSIVIKVSQLARLRDWYCEALGFVVIAADGPLAEWRVPVAGRCARLRLGAQEIELIEYKNPGEAVPADQTAADLGFQHFAIVTDDIGAASERARGHGISSISRDGPQQLPPSSGGVRAFKFRDPDGHPLELLEFPPKSMPQSWVASPRTAAATLGIDHSAICVADTPRSIAFYASLGLSPGAAQVNSGPEQDRLDGLSEVVVDVTALAPGVVATPHLELLGYRAPLPRPRSRVDERDLADTELVFAVDALPAERMASVTASGGPAEVQQAAGVARLRDPDGHSLVLVERRAA